MIALMMTPAERDQLLLMMSEIHIVPRGDGLPLLVAPAYPLVIDFLSTLGAAEEDAEADDDPAEDDDSEEEDDPTEDGDPDELNGDEMEASEPGDAEIAEGLRWRQEVALNFGRSVDRAPEDARPCMLPIEFGHGIRKVT